jgi:hypothetical protein
MPSKPEFPHSPEREEELFRNYLAAEEEVEAVMREINEILAGAEDRLAAERSVLDTHAYRLDQATKKSRELLDKWLAHLQDLS